MTAVEEQLARVADARARCACYKARFDTERQARDGAQPATVVYGCGYCGGWHITIDRTPTTGEPT